MQSHTTPVVRFGRGSTPRVVPGVDVVPRRRRDRGAPRDRGTAENGPLPDAEAQDRKLLSRLVTCVSGGTDRGMLPWVGQAPVSQPAAACEGYCSMTNAVTFSGP